MITSGNELNTCNGIFKTGSNYKYKYDSDQFQIEYWYRYVISCILYQYLSWFTSGSVLDNLISGIYNNYKLEKLSISNWI